MFIFLFGNVEDRQQIFFCGPWSYENQLISLVRPEVMGEIDKMDFSCVPFWIQLGNVPMACMYEDYAYYLGGLIGLVEEAEVRGSRIRVRVRINMMSPLNRGIHVYLEEVQTEVSIQLQYEYLPEVCFRCGLIVHRTRECVKRPQYESTEDGSEKFCFGPWLSAIIP